jgi:hypothetical protein
LERRVADRGDALAVGLAQTAAALDLPAQLWESLPDGNAQGRFGLGHAVEGNRIEQARSGSQQRGDLLGDSGGLVLRLLEDLADPAASLQRLAGLGVQPRAEAREDLQLGELGWE